MIALHSGIFQSHLKTTDGEKKKKIECTFASAIQKYYSSCATCHSQYISTLVRNNTNDWKCLRKEKIIQALAFQK